MECYFVRCLSPCFYYPLRQPSQRVKSELPKWRENARPKTAQSPAGRYSPLAAAGGYQGQTHTWHDSLFAAMNPRGIDWGAVWEQRRANLRRNMLLNGYFWTCLTLTVLFAIALFCWYVAWNDRRIAIAEGGRQIRMLTAEADECRAQAEAAITRYNIHIERCNLVSESSGDAAAEPSDYLLLRKQFENLATERVDKNAEVERERAASRQLRERIMELEKHANGSVPASQALVERINRLEEDLRLLRDENKRLKARKASA